MFVIFPTCTAISIYSLKEFSERICSYFLNNLLFFLSSSLFLNYTYQWYQSLVITMDTHGKTNAEFRSDVNEILARHESNFNQVNAALQAVLTELQALRASRGQNNNSSETNPFACDESSHPHTSRSNTTKDYSNHNLKLSFPKFNGDDPTGWIYKAEQYFEFQNIALDQQVQLASFHLEGIALQWHR